MDEFAYIMAILAYVIAIVCLARVRRLEAGVARLNEKVGLVSESPGRTVRPLSKWIFVLAFVLGLVSSVGFFVFMLLRGPQSP